MKIRIHLEGEPSQTGDRLMGSVQIPLARDTGKKMFAESLPLLRGGRSHERSVDDVADLLVTINLHLFLLPSVPAAPRGPDKSSKIRSRPTLRSRPPFPAAIDLPGSAGRVLLDRWVPASAASERDAGHPQCALPARRARALGKQARAIRDPVLKSPSSRG